ncbi:hypothetical protein FXO38_02912 [Capsicum annuum]
MEAITHLTKQRAKISADMNGLRLKISERMGGMEKRLVQVERGKSIQLEDKGVRRASVQSTTITLGQAHKLWYPSPNQTRNFQQPTFQMNNTPSFSRKLTPYPHRQPYHPLKENRLFWTIKFDAKLHLKHIKCILT